LICTAFLLGAAAGGYATHKFGNPALWCVICVLVLTAIGVRSRLLSMPEPAADRSNEVSPAASGTTLSS
jgi:uncharacterized membrane protein YoaK (UPF0700 family)